MASTINASNSGSGGLISTGDASGVLALQTGGTTAVTVDTAQNVGIGTTSPTAKVDVNGGINANSSFSFSGANYVYSYASGALGDIRSGFKLDGTNNLLQMFTGTSERMRIDSSGSVGIGTASPSASATRLVVKGAGTSTNTLSVFRNSADTTLFSLREDGFAYFPPTYSNTTVNAANFFINNDGALYRSTSSIKYKKNVQDSTHGLADLMKLRSVIYEGKTEGDAGKVIGGLIAEEVNDAGLTEFVEFAPDGSPDALAYGNMVALCVKAIQELKAINDTQAATINAQSAALAALTARVVALEGK